MNVEILNPNEVKELFADWGKCAAICYNTKTSKPENIGKHCMKSGHTSGSRGTYIKFLITDVPRSSVDQIVRHENGVFKNVQSFRYVDKSTFSYEIPKEITDNDYLMKKYIEYMDNVMNLYEEIQSYIYEKTNNKERANEQARYVLPMSTHSSFVIGFDIEALIHFMHKRLCNRTEDITKKIAITMKNATVEIMPELKNYLIPECQYLLWCPEMKSCGAYPNKNELIDKLHREEK